MPDLNKLLGSRTCIAQLFNQAACSCCTCRPAALPPPLYTHVTHASAAEGS